METENVSYGYLAEQVAALRTALDEAKVAAAGQYSLGVRHVKDAIRNAIINTMRDTVSMGGMDKDDAQNLLDALLYACDMSPASVLIKWNVYATLGGNDFYSWDDVEASTEEEAISLVRDSFTVSDVSLSVSFYTETGGYSDAQVQGFDFDIEDALDWSAEEE
jgi:hypothetical protein